jgi:hypothetical protein
MTQAKWLLQAAAGVALALVVPLTVLGAEDKERGVGDVVYVPTPQVVVDEMLRMAKIGPKDFIIDLGSGDGRMVITAAKKFGAQGFGVDLSDDLLREARANAKIEGVVDRAEFRKQNLFETDLKQATVLSTYLLPEMNEKLRPKILALPPGTRVDEVEQLFVDAWRLGLKGLTCFPQRSALGAVLSLQRAPTD